MPSEAPCSPRVSTPAGSGGGQSPVGSPSHSRRRVGVVRHRYRHDVTPMPTGQRAAVANTRLKGSLPPIQTCLPLSRPDTRTSARAWSREPRVCAGRARLAPPHPRAPQLAAPTRLPHRRRDVHRALAARQDARPRRTRERRATRTVRRPLAAHPVGNLSIARAPRAPAKRRPPSAGAQPQRPNGSSDGVGPLHAVVAVPAAHGVAHAVTHKRGPPTPCTHSRGISPLGGHSGDHRMPETPTEAPGAPNGSNVGDQTAIDAPDQSSTLRVGMDRATAAAHCGPRPRAAR